MPQESTSVDKVYGLFELATGDVVWCIEPKQCWPVPVLKHKDQKTLRLIDATLYNHAIRRGYPYIPFKIMGEYDD